MVGGLITRNAGILQKVNKAREQILSHSLHKGIQFWHLLLTHWDPCEISDLQTVK